SLGNGSYSATFRDAMRVSSNNSQFFKNNTSTNSTSVSEGLERHRVWLSLSSAQGSYNQMLVGYVQGATNDFDSLYDGKTLPAGNPVSIYTTVGTDNLSIQGRTLPFDARDVVPVGYTTTINGELTITLDNYDGLFDEQDVYLLDKFTGIYHDLKAGNFTFTTTSGTFNNRFELHYTTTALGIDTPTVVDKDIKVITNNRELTVLCAAASITKVEVFDILGKLLFTQNNLNTHELQTTTLNIAPQMILVKVTTDNGQTITKKTLIQ
ncbi:T9SS sorting signal type C domain-containing protein, partial [Flavobacterium sp.]|uniref:T9SS sorting signal type C domain-containing protein n=2 Tax=Flavobacterium sp. TaxID=239 RepID=UPI002FD9F3D4